MVITDGFIQTVDTSRKTTSTQTVGSERFMFNKVVSEKTSDETEQTEVGGG